MAQRIYRTQDGQDYFVFDVVRLPDNTLRAYIDAQPSYGTRSDDGHSTHRYSDGTRHYICYEEKVYGERDMFNVMKYFAEETQHYIRTGVPFRQPGK